MTIDTDHNLARNIHMYVVRFIASKTWDAYYEGQVVEHRLLGQ